jgi:hypothetical protein
VSEERVEQQQEPAAADDPREDYAAPTLSELGSFEELTQLGGTGSVDAEGKS